MHTLILTCAGESSRFPGKTPKWALTHPKGNIMAVESVAGIRGYDRVVVAVREDHVQQFGADALQTELASLNCELLPLAPTANQVGTVAAVLKMLNIEGTFTVKDCDNRFDYRLPTEGCAVAVCDLHTVGLVVPGNKSYVKADGEKALRIQERQIIGHQFCCGAYTFRLPELFFKHDAGKLYLSEVLQSILMEEPVWAKSAYNYVDWGTAQDWALYTRRWKTLFVDLDGVVFRSGHRSFSPKWGENGVIERNVEYLNGLSYVQIVLTTSRPERMREQTKQQLEEVGLRYDQLVMGLNVCSRVLVNDFVQDRGRHTSFAVNLERDSDKLEEQLRAVLRET